MTKALRQPSVSSTEEASSSFQLLTITENAANKVWELIEEEEEEEADPKLKLRVFVTGGGCSGFQYGFTFDKIANPDDIIITKTLKKKSVDSEDEKSDGDEGGSTTVWLLIDATSLAYLKGAEIDYKSDLSGEQFIIRNPNAKTTCGCGSSFAA